MKFSKLADYFQKLEKTTSRNRMTEILADLLAKAGSDEVDKICYLSLGRLAPLYAGIEFNLAEKMMIKVIALASKGDEKNIRRRYKELGDLGDVIFKIKNQSASWRTKINPPSGGQKSKLSVIQAFEWLWEIAGESGEGSVERKITKMAKLLAELDARSSKYVVRIPLGKLRLGFSDKTILDALSWMIAGDKSKREEVEGAYNVRADVGQIARRLRQLGLRSLRGLRVQMGTPIMPALCQRLPTAEEMIEKVGQPAFAKASTSAEATADRSAGKVAVEPKYDGTRLQIHFSRKRKWEQAEDQLAFGFKPQGFVRIFTRNLENVTSMFPDLVRAVFREIRAQEAILDGEAIGFDPKSGKFLPFQETIKRKRKYEVGQKAKEIPLKYFCFDILYKDGQDLLKRPFSERRKILGRTVSPKNKTIVPSPQIITNDSRVLRRYHNEQIRRGLEGAVVKKWNAPYDPGRRGFTWVKFKQEKGKKGGGLADTLDCLVMGYYRGRGKRAGFGIGAFLVGVRADKVVKVDKVEKVERGDFLTISKIGTGLTDEQWRELKIKSQKLKVKSQPKEYWVDKNLVPDVWVAPGLVVEIEADNITRSPIHTAGLALRFPRLIRFRDDKSPEQATTLAETEKLYRLQK